MATVEFSRNGYRRHADPLDVSRVPFEEADPIRSFPSWPGKRHYQGKLWLSSTGQHVPFESFWERACLAILDRTPGVVGVASQPMWIHWRDPKRSHAPDYFVRNQDGAGTLVDVKPRERTKPEGLVKFELTRRLAEALGWRYLVLDELPGATEANLRFLLRYRDPAWLEGVDLDSLPVGISMTLRDLVTRLSPVSASGIGAAYAMVWKGAARADLVRPLSMTTLVRLEAAS